MARKTKRSYIAILGGIIALLGVVLSIFIRELGWWNFLSVIGDNVDYTDTWASAFFGDTDPYFNPEFTYLLICGEGIFDVRFNPLMSIYKINFFHP